MNKINYTTFKALHSKFIEHSTFTKEKKDDLNHLMSYLKSHDFVEIQIPHKKFPFKKIWNYDIYEVPFDKLGKLKKWRGEKVLRFCIQYQIYKPDTIICCPIIL